jgi:catalase
VAHLHIREAMVGHLRHIDEKLAKRVASGLGMAKLPKAPAAAAPVIDMDPSPWGAASHPAPPAECSRPQVQPA